MLFGKKRWTFFLLILFQAAVILFTASYFVFFTNTNRPKGFNNGRDRQHLAFDVKRENNATKFQRNSPFKAFHLVVQAKRLPNVQDSYAVKRMKRKNDINNIHMYSKYNKVPKRNVKNRGKANKKNMKHDKNSNNHDYMSSKVNVSENNQEERKDDNNIKINKEDNKNSYNRRYYKSNEKIINNNDNNNNNNNNNNNQERNKNHKYINNNNQDINKNNNNNKDTNNKYNMNNHHISYTTKQTLKDNRKPILMFIAIMSAPARIQRRNALRRSWLRQCKQHNTSCYIFSDARDMNGERLPENVYTPLEQEQFLHNDLILSDSPGGINFATRYLWIINWANKRYKFDFLLRVDDDYFICMDRLFLELPLRRALKKLYWGFVHCQPQGGVRVDEGFVIVSNDLVQHFIREQNNSLMCHPFGDQAMAMWINDIEDVIYFGDPRVYYDVSANQPILEQHSDICETFLALHGSYPVEIEKFWHRVLITPWRKYSVPAITYPCGDQDRKYNKTSFLGMYYADPIPCKYSPIWNIGNVYVGRSGEIPS